MLGFIGKLFGSKLGSETINDESNLEKAQAAPKRPVRNPAPRTNAGNAFYLDADSAKTLGNLDYMRSSKSVRRTFPKAKVGEDNELVRNISAMEAERLGVSPAPTQPTAGSAGATTTSSLTPSATPTSERRSADSSMDMFRAMAREIKKG